RIGKTSRRAHMRRPLASIRLLSKMIEIRCRRKGSAAVKIDLLYEIQPQPKPWPKPFPEGQREVERAAYLETMEQVKLADKLGFETVWFVEHHFREQRSHCPAPEVLLGAASQVTDRIRLGFGVTLLPQPFQHPARA